MTLSTERGEFAIGLDVGGTKIAAGLVDRSGRVRVRRTAPTNAGRSGQTVLDDALALVRVLQNVAHDEGWRVAGVGVSICELVDLQGNVTSGYTVRWQGLPVQEAFSQVISPAVVEADVRAHALAEATFGAGSGLESFVFVSIGSGISSCLVLHGRPFAGAHGNALVLSTMPLTVFDEHERKIEFALEAFASGVGLTERYRRHNGDVTRVEQIVADAEQGSETAATILRSGGEALGSALAWLVNVLDPAALIVGGGLGLADGLYWQSAISAIRSHIFADESRAVPILKAACGADAGVIGAAVRVFQEAKEL
jgi:glucokinase